jgi:hypothetical protein
LEKKNNGFNETAVPDWFSRPEKIVKISSTFIPFPKGRVQEEDIGNTFDLSTVPHWKGTKEKVLGIPSTFQPFLIGRVERRRYWEYLRHIIHQREWQDWWEKISLDQILDWVRHSPLLYLQGVSSIIIIHDLH